MARGSLCPKFIAVVMLGSVLAPLPRAEASIREAATVLTPDPPGVFGVLNDLITTPAGDILGSDDRGLFKWSATQGWKLEVESNTVPSCGGGGRCDDPFNSEWGIPTVIATSARNFMVIEPTGHEGTIAINRSVGGEMSDTWETVVVSNLEWVEYVCTDTPRFPGSLYAQVWTHSLRSPISSVFVSEDLGISWSRTELSNTEELCAPGAQEGPTIEEINNTDPGAFGYLGGIWSFADNGDVQMVSTFGGMFASNDDGASWVSQSRGIPLHPRLRLPYTRFGSSVLMGGMAEQENALFRSDDAGKTFTRVNGTPYDNPFTYIRLQSTSVAYGSYKWWDNSDRSGPRIYRSNDGGLTWGLLNSGDITFVAESEATGWAGQSPVLIADTTSPGVMTAVMEATDDKYWFTQSTDAGETWDAMSEIADCQPHVGDPYVDGDLFMVPAKHVVDGTLRYGYCRSTDGGASWTFAPITTSRQFKPGALLTDSDGNLLAITALAPFESADDGATWSLKTCANTTQPIGAIDSGSFDSDGALWVVYFDSAGVSPPNVYRSPDEGCSWDVTSVTNSLDEELEDQVLDIEPDPDAIVEESLRPSAAGTSRTVRLIGVGLKGSTRAKVYWGKVPTAVRRPSASVSGRNLTLRFTAPTAPGPGSVTYTSRCISPKKRTSVVTNKLNSHLHRNLVVGATYACTITATNPIGESPSVRVSKKIVD